MLNNPKVTVIDYDGRLYLAHTKNRYDVIDLSLADSAGLSSPGGFAIVEKYSYTREAMSAYMRALKPGGILSVTLWNKEEPPKSVLKLYATMAAAARDVAGEDGRADIAKDFYVVSTYLSTATVLYKRGGFTRRGDRQAATPIPRRCRSTRSTIPASRSMSRQLAQILQDYRDQFFSQGEAADPTVPSEQEPNDKPPPGMTAAAAPAADAATEAKDGTPPTALVPATVMGRLAWHYLVNGGWQKVADDYVFDTRILTNHQPYFAAYIKVKDLPKFTDRLELVQDEWGYLLLWATLGIAAIFAFTLVLFPLIFGWRTIFSRYPGKFGTMIYFLCLGLGYIIVEVGMIAHFILALSNATVSASVLITGMLVFSGLGSFVSERFLDRARSVMPKIFLAIFLILTLYAFTIDYALDWIGTLPYALRIVLCLLLLMPPAFLMGFPMPTAMTTLGRLGKDHMFLWAWGINGCFSVIGAALVPIVATSFGLPAVVLAGRRRLSGGAACLLLRAEAAPRRAACGRVKRRALLLGALLMPTAARAKTTKQASQEAGRRSQAGTPAAERSAAAEAGEDCSSSPSTPRSSPIAASCPTPTSRSSMPAPAASAATPASNGDVFWEEPDLQRPPLAALSAGRLRSAARRR